MSVRIITGDCRDVLATLPAESVHCVVTSPPYFGLRDYGVDGQIGLEDTPDAFVAEMVAVFREVRRVLRADGTLWLNLGDSYANDGKWGGSSGGKHVKALHGATAIGRAKVHTGLKPKDLIGIPWRVAFALQADGWVLRQEIIWAKPNPMPESVTDRCTKSHEQLFLFSKASWSGPEPGRFAHISDEDARWLALCIDTEGCIVVKRCQHEGRADTFAPQVSFGSTSRALMDRFIEIVGHGNLAERAGQNQPMIYWQVANNIARDFLHRIYPYLIVKQRQARVGIHVDDLTYFRGGKRSERKQRTDAETARLVSLWVRNKALNHFGAPDISDVPEPEFGRWAAGPRYHFDADAIAEPLGAASVARLSQNVDDQAGSDRVPGKTNGTMKAVGRRAAGNKTHKGTTAYEAGDERLRTKAGLVSFAEREREKVAAGDLVGTRNRRSVWTVPTRPFKEAHFATFPPALVEPCILAGCPNGGTVLDPFGGAGTTGLVADRLGRSAVLIELNPAYAEIATRRLADDRGPLLDAILTVPR